jgi:hypothetical protein
VDLEWTAEDIAFRDEVRAFFAEKLPPHIRPAGQLMTSVYADHAAEMEWHKILFARERIAAGAPPLSPMSMEQVPFVLMKFGTETQKAPARTPYCQTGSRPDKATRR